VSPGRRDPIAIRHGVALPTGGNLGSELLAIGGNLERLGFDSLWLSEVDSDPAPPRDALAICSALGVVTAEIGLVALLAPGARLPTVAAKAASGTDRMCGGRLALGLSESEGAEDIRATLDGRGPPNLPPPAGPVPLWLTGDDAADAAARLADGWFVGWNQDTSRVVQAMHRLEEECDAQGRDPRSIRVAVGAVAMVGADLAVAQSQQWTAERGREWVAEMSGAGATDLVLSFAARPFGWSGGSVAAIWAAEIWATEVLGPSSTDDGYDGGERRRR
jgi:alkanesulfonate monooxygenase SsuD/methylene tetrahydromethanopterin reductase-like flavin-dependent oxidoreductase (luciferase family)